MGQVRYVGNQPDLGAPIWRYLDLFKFVAIIAGREIPFCRPDLLGDNWEGSINDATVAGMRRRVLAKPENVDAAPAVIDAQVALMREADRKGRLGLQYASCWHRADSESSLMWRSYGDRGLAIQTTIGDLSASLRSAQFHVMAGDIQYVDDYTNPNLDLSSDSMSPILHKRWPFQSEHEYRFVAVDEQMLVEAHRNQDGELGVLPPVLNVPIDPARLIQSVVVAPKMDDWMVKVVQNLALTYGLSASIVKRSVLDDIPMLE